MTKMWLFCSGSFLMCNTQRIINNSINEAQLPAHKNEKWQWCLHGEKNSEEMSNMKQMV